MALIIGGGRIDAWMRSYVNEFETRAESVTFVTRSQSYRRRQFAIRGTEDLGSHECTNRNRHAIAGKEFDEGAAGALAARALLPASPPGRRSAVAYY
jgi:hypothetical protein